MPLQLAIPKQIYCNVYRFLFNSFLHFLSSSSSSISALFFRIRVKYRNILSSCILRTGKSQLHQSNNWSLLLLLPSLHPFSFLFWIFFSSAFFIISIVCAFTLHKLHILEFVAMFVLRLFFNDREIGSKQKIEKKLIKTR